MGLIKGFKEFLFEALLKEPFFHCNDFEGNSGYLELKRIPNIHRRTKHINLVFHHFREYVRKGLVYIL